SESNSKALAGLEFEVVFIFLAPSMQVQRIYLLKRWNQVKSSTFFGLFTDLRKGRGLYKNK
ncbi:MAG TPA: hypothetical protein PL012_20330, partial [Candidatus Obscuribacter sp.]|nr:hypothetical protein [Candidatus Obscuribacter sp.]